MLYLFDTDTLTRAHAGNDRIAGRIKQHGEENVATSVVTAIEVLRGRHEYLLKAVDAAHLLQAQSLLDRTKELLDDILVPVDADVASEFDRLRHNKKLKKIGRADLLIACFALARKAILVTRNVKHFQQVPGLKIENWID